MLVAGYYTGQSISVITESSIRQHCESLSNPYNIYDVSISPHSHFTDEETEAQRH